MEKNAGRYGLMTFSNVILSKNNQPELEFKLGLLITVLLIV